VELPVFEELFKCKNHRMFHIDKRQLCHRSPSHGQNQSLQCCCMSLYKSPTSWHVKMLGCGKIVEFATYYAVAWKVQ